MFEEEDEEIDVASKGARGQRGARRQGAFFDGIRSFFSIFKFLFGQNMFFPVLPPCFCAPETGPKYPQKLSPDTARPIVA